MAIKRYTANSDTTITNAFESNLTKRGTEANMGASDILEIFSLYGQNGGTSSELERALIKFPVDEIISDRAAEDIPAVGKVNFYLKMHNAPHSQTLPRNFTLSAKKVITDWQEGIGLDMEEYKDKTYGNAGATWISASNTAAWARMGGDYAETEYKQTFEKGTEDLEIDITTLVEDWVLNGSNYGLGLQLTASEEAYYADYYPREAVTFDQLAWLSGSGTDVSSSSGKDTISAWIYIPPYLPGGKGIISWTTPASPPGVSRRLARNYQSKFNYYRKWTSGVLDVLTANTLQDDAWTHITITDDTTSETNLPTLYINGISQSVSITDGRSPSDIPIETLNFSMGGEKPHLFPNWSGSIDDVSYYDRILTSTEILEIYNNGCPTNLKEIHSSQASLKNWWINGDDPRDVIHLGTPPLSASIYDQVGTYNLYATGSGTMAITASVCAGGGGVLAQDAASGQLINAEGSSLNYYTKKFFARSSEFFFKRPVIEARWNSSIQDDRGDFYASSSMVPAADNLNTIYLYNISRGQYVDIPNYDADLNLRIYATLGGSTIGSSSIGRVSAGIYSASFALDTTASTVYDVWFSGSAETRVNFHTGTIDVKTHAGSTSQPNTEYYSNITNLKPIYSTDESPRLQLYVRPKDWSPTIYTVASQDIETTPIEKAAYKVYRVVDDLEVIPYGTGSDNHTIMSYDEKGNHFNLDMSLLQPDYAYGIKVAFYNPSTKSYVEQRQAWKFRVEDLDSQ